MKNLFIVFSLLSFSFLGLLPSSSCWSMKEGNGMRNYYEASGSGPFLEGKSQHKSLFSFETIVDKDDSEPPVVTLTETMLGVTSKHWSIIAKRANSMDSSFTIVSNATAPSMQPKVLSNSLYLSPSSLFYALFTATSVQPLVCEVNIVTPFDKIKLLSVPRNQSDTMWISTASEKVYVQTPLGGIYRIISSRSLPSPSISLSLSPNSVVHENKRGNEYHVGSVNDDKGLQKSTFAVKIINESAIDDDVSYKEYYSRELPYGPKVFMFHPEFKRFMFILNTSSESPKLALININDTKEFDFPANSFVEECQGISQIAASEYKENGTDGTFYTLSGAGCICRWALKNGTLVVLWSEKRFVTRSNLVIAQSFISIVKKVLRETVHVLGDNQGGRFIVVIDGYSGYLLVNASTTCNSRIAVYGNMLACTATSTLGTTAFTSVELYHNLSPSPTAPEPTEEKTELRPWVIPVAVVIAILGVVFIAGIVIYFYRRNSVSRV